MKKRYDTFLIVSLFVLSCMIISIIILVVLTIHTHGYRKGYADSTEDTKRIRCQLEYGGTERSEIAGNCLKYFDAGVPQLYD